MGAVRVAGGNAASPHCVSYCSVAIWEYEVGDVMCSPSRQVVVVVVGIDGDPSDLQALTPADLKRPLGHFG